MHALVKSKVSKIKFYLSLVYAFNSSDGRVSLWQDIENLSAQVYLPWVIGGDFNTTMFYGERMTGGEVVTGETDELMHISASCQLQDLNYTGFIHLV